MDTSKAESMTDAPLLGRTEAIRKRIHQELSQESTSSLHSFIMHYVERWDMLQDDEGSSQKSAHSHPWHDWYDSDRP